MNPALCKHCMHERKQHDALRQVSDYQNTSLEYLLQVVEKLEIEIQYEGQVADVELEEMLVEELEELELRDK